MTEFNVQRNQDLEIQEKQRSIAAANQNTAVARVVNIVYFLFGLIELLLAVRVVLHLIGANPANGFANFIYVLSSPFLILFSTLMTNPTLGPNAALEITTIIAMIVYAILAYLIGRLVWLALSRPR
jgi:hypothetical protein